jgi:GNAT superfamily N-acetyltransferase
MLRDAVRTPRGVVVSLGPLEGFSLRAVTFSDAEVVADVVNDCAQAEIDLTWITPEEMRNDWSGPGYELPADALLVDERGEAAGYLQLWCDIEPYDELLSLVFVRARYWSRGLSAFLLRLGEERARERIHRAPADLRVTHHVARFAHNEAAAQLFRSLDYAYHQTTWVMRIELDGPPPTPPEIEGITIRTFDPERDTLATHVAMTEAFLDHRGHEFPSYEQWRHHHMDGEGTQFDRRLWFVAADGEEIVGAAICRPTTARDRECAEVETLGVRRAWRKRGVGLALLRAAFGEFHRRGILRAELGVDSENPTGATRLYEGAGMHVAYSWETWEKELRPGTARPTHAGFAP